jgi:hypothetical protein
VLHYCRALRGGLDLIGMVLAIDLDHQPTRYAGEVREVASDWVLTAKFDAIQAAIPKELPHLVLGAAAVATEVARSLGDVFVSGHDPLT